MIDEQLKILLPYPLYSLYAENAPAEELRLTLGCRVLVKSGGHLRETHLVCTKELLEDIMRRMLNRSFYAHEETIREGYISLPEGLRAGVCGRAVCRNGKIFSVKDVTSLVLRIPRRIPGIERLAIDLLKKEDFTKGMLFYSLPGVGKTTLLRELAFSIGEKYRKSVALIDTRGELSAGIGNGAGLSVFLHYPKAEGVSIAVRTMSPDILVLDEIGSEECASLIEAGFGGVTALASCHASSLAELKERPGFSSLLRSGVFPHIARLTRKGEMLSIVLENEVL